MSAVLFKSYDEMDEHERDMADIVRLAIDDSMWLVADKPVTHLYYLLAAHPRAMELFVLITVPDGPIVALTPLNPEAWALLEAQVPGAVPGVPSGVREWANRQHWTPLAGVYMRRREDGDWEAYNPREER